ESCFVFFDTVKWMVTFPDTPCGHIISSIDFYCIQTVLTTIFLLDCTTLIFLRIQHTSTKSLNPSGNLTDAAQRKRQQTEIRFLKQALCENALLICQHISYHCIRPLFENRWAIYFASTFPWELSNALDGFIIVLFHFRFSHLIKKSSPTKLTLIVQPAKTHK
ncbi:hypothetical protein KIN20_030783, partial [Parelaphostrongylus tenuis]